MKTKKIMLGLGLVFASVLVRSQGLENVTVEKYYVSNAADAAAADADATAGGIATGQLPVGSVTYRIFADMLPGYKFQAAYGVASHTLKVTTTTAFYNNSSGSTAPNWTKNAAKNNVLALDSWFSVGASTNGQFGILKTEDNGVANNVTVAANPSGVLLNADPIAGIALTTQDGIIAGTVQAVTFVGFTTELDAISDGTVVGNSIITNNASVAALSGATGPIPATNRVLIGQFTTNGVFHYELNIQIGTPTGGVEKYVASSPGAGETLMASLTGTLGAVNSLPTVSISSPSNGSNFVIGSAVALAANAADADGTVASVEFFVDAVSVGIDNTSPYTGNYGSITAGAHTLTAKATDDQGGVTTSASVTINGVSNPPPTVSITSPANAASFIAPDAVAITANAADDISVTSVEFFVDGVSLSIDNTSPYAANYSPSVAGNHSLTARATDNLGAQTTSAAVSITVTTNVAPSVSITAPANGASGFPSVVAINANAADADGSVASVEFFKDGVSLGVDATSPYSVNWTSVVGDIGVRHLTARATDDRGTTTTSAVINYEVLDPNAAYKVGKIVEKCLVSTYCVPVTATSAVSPNVTGYDLVLHYNKSKVKPTGVITKASVLLSSAFYDVASYFDTVGVNNNINISLFLNGTAPTGSVFAGTGDLFCVEFTKTSGFLSNDVSLFNVTNLVESTDLSTAVKQVTDGSVTLFRDTAFAGHLQYWDNTKQPLGYSTVGSYLASNVYGTDASCVVAPAAAVQPNLTGDFTYNIQNGHSISIVRDIPNVGQTAAILGFIGGNDAQLAAKVLVNNPSFTPNVFQLIAIDVNRDGKVSAGDVSQMSQRAVRHIVEFVQVTTPVRDWLFADSALLATAPYMAGGFSKSSVPVIPFCLTLPIADYNCPDIKATKYTGIMLGDVDTSYVSGSNDGIFKKLANPLTNDKVIFDLSKAIVKDGFVNVPVSVSSKNDVNSVDFSLQYNEGSMNYQSMINHSGVTSLVNYVQDDKTLNLTSYSLDAYKKNEAILSLRFATSSQQLSATDLSSITAYVNGKPSKVEITTGVAYINAENLVSIYPNPANDAINVEVTERSTVQLLDMSGKQVVTGTVVNANEKQTISTENITAGIYMMKISNDNFVTIKKVIVNK